MKIHELLQIEIWSKKTSRKILAKFGIVVVTLALGFGVLHVVERYWLTPGERHAGRAVLAQIDALQNIESISREDFDAGVNGSVQELKAASEACWTGRDKAVYSELFLYLLMTESERRDVFMQEQVQQSDPSTTSSNRVLGQKVEKEEQRLIRLQLHKELD